MKTRMAKSVLGAGWGQLKTMLEYKCAHAGIVFKVVGEMNRPGFPGGSHS
ncbi:hypothetical protein [Azorhizophilus paspali]|uniref:Transposase n=1 Tax=Azorhizophilus paspali TaxID=69963 RepID=A0ABV6SLZ9_AZOPA